MQLEITKSMHGYRIINKSNKKHAALKEIAKLVNANNKLSGTVKIGIYNVSLPPFSKKATVYSYNCNRTEKLTKSEYYKWMGNKKTFKPKKSMESIWASVNPDEFTFVASLH